MQLLDNNTQAFLALVRAGLWEQEARLLPFEEVDFSEVQRLAEEQSVVGLVAAGLEHVVDVKVPQIDFLTFVGRAVQIEQQNTAMNDFIGVLFDKMRKAGISSLLVKGQGVAQCYERPLWRTAGDVDLLLDDNNYDKGKAVLYPIAYDIQKEEPKSKHQAMIIMDMDVELHGKMPFAMSKRVDKVIDDVIKGSVISGGVSVWLNKDTDIFLPNPDNHIILIFTHFLHHFFIEGVGLRQICDWCRILWKHKDEINLNLLEQRIKDADLMSEWQAFASLAVNTLGMPEDTMPFNKNNFYNRWKANRVLNRVLKNGNFGHNNDLSYRIKYKGLTYKMVSLWRRLCDFVAFTFIFPLDAPRFFFAYVYGKIQ